jgi:hypothetical protein
MCVTLSLSKCDYHQAVQEKDGIVVRLRQALRRSPLERLKHTLFQLRIIMMPLRIPIRFLLKILLQRLR